MYTKACRDLYLMSRKYRPRHGLAGVTVKCGNLDKSRPAWLIPLQKDQLPRPAREAFPRRRPAAAPKAGPSLNRIKAAAAARGCVRNGTEVKTAPEDIFYKANKKMVSQRNALTNKVIKKLARQPTKAFR